ncbi:MAG: aspartate aminotransferase family protein [Firmicutes bacterium]|nr:aspartate aminotransferase family protein [Bacillota bacterium]
MDGLVTLEDALTWDRERTYAEYKDHVNPGMAKMLNLLNFNKAFVRAEGVYLYDRDGRAYLDFLGGYGAVNIGHNHPRVIAALEEVAERPKIVPAALNPLAAALAHNLSRLTPGKINRFFFGNSGAEAVEGALKTARAATGRDAIIYAEGAFHGKTFGALSVTGRDKYRKAFGSLLPNTLKVPYGDADALEALLESTEVAAVILEPIQGEGGVLVPPAGYLKAAKKLCQRYGALLILDEIQTGFGRTGKFFAAQWEEVEPDIICLAKSIGAGYLPLGAFGCTDEVWEAAYGGLEKALLHTSTFGGNTAAMAAGLAALEVLVEEDLAGKADELGTYFLNQLTELAEKYPIIKEVRGRGLLIGLEFNGSGKKSLFSRMGSSLLSRLSEEYVGGLVAGELLNKHAILTAYTLNNPNVIRMEPPLVVTKAEVDQVLNSLDHLLAKNKGFGKLALSVVGGKLGLS